MSHNTRNELSIDENDCFLLVQKSALSNLISPLLCPGCLKTGIKFDVDVKNAFGFAIRGYLMCENCCTLQGENYMCNRMEDDEGSLTRMPFEVNMRAIIAFRGIGCGYAAMKDWSALMNFPSCLSKPSYQVLQRKVFEGCKAAYKEVSTNNVDKIRNMYKEHGSVEDDEGILDISVSFDGTWQKRGHSSHNGAAVVIDLLTGLPIDYEVLSNFCGKCANGPSPSDDDYDDWKRAHEPVCKKNFEGTANAMEAECAKRIWRRSEKRFKLRYTTMLSDGDSKSFDAVKEENVYNGVSIKKEECVNHVSKRMGTALANLVTECKARRTPISGKGKLTKEKIIKIQNYYGKAIKDAAGDVILMRQRIFAILFHMSSTDREPKHMHCPQGETSWCFYQRAVSKNAKPESHKEHETFPVDVGKMLVPIFQRLIDMKLLDRCKHNLTQNPNESLHSVIWRFCPKITYVGPKTVEISVCMAICQYAMGASFREILFKLLGVEPGAYLREASRKKDQQRLAAAVQGCSNERKQRRRKLKFEKTGKEKKLKKREGATYKSGSFD